MNESVEMRYTSKGHNYKTKVRNKRIAVKIREATGNIIINM